MIPARVARVSKRQHDRDPMPPTQWREVLRIAAALALALLAGIGLGALFIVAMNIWRHL
jgi:hypothetical protein